MTVLHKTDREAALSRLGEALRRRVGRGCDWSAERVAAALGCSVAAVKAWRRGEAAPDGPTLLRLAALLGPDFLNELLQPLGLGGLHLLEEPELCSLKLNAQAAALTALISGHAEDGHIDHREVAEQIPAVRELYSACGRFLTTHEPLA